MKNFSLNVDADGVGLITFDAPARSMNTLTAIVLQELGNIIARIVDDAGIVGAVIISGKSSGFCAGADLGEIGSQAASADTSEASRQALFDRVFGINRLFRSLETCGKPIAAAVNGLALGGGFELALACHYRVVADDPKLQLGLPESKVGLLPGGGGTQRLPRLIGAAKALPLLLEGKSVSPADALKLGLVHEVAAASNLIGAARNWVLTKGDATAPWDRKEFRIPGGGPYTPATAQVFVVGNAMLRKQSFGNYPAQIAIMKCVYEGLQVPFDAGLRIESRYFAQTLMTPQARAMIRTLFHSMDKLSKGAVRPTGVPQFKPGKVAVLGAGMMGAGIAYVQAVAGIETVLIDTTDEGAARGRDHGAQLLDKAVSRGKITRDKADRALSLIHATTDYKKVTGSDLVVEAVFEERALKADVTRRAEAMLDETATFGSNTSTLPITGLAEASVRPANFVGIHFFSPVDRMGLVEIIRAKHTSQATLARAIDYVLAIRKTPIVVNDSRGFYTSRCFATFIQEGLEMLMDGVAPAIIDNVGRACGMPRGPLEMHDDVALDLSYKVRQQTRKDLGEAFVENRSDAVIERMVTGLSRFGRKNGRGFYDYAPDGSKNLWPGLSELAPVVDRSAAPEHVQELRTRLLYRQAVEAARCMEEKVVTDPREADVGAILGWGFAPWTGGPISLIDGVGLQNFVDTCDELARKHGPRFTPPHLLRDMAAAGRTFYDTELRDEAEAAD